MIKLLFGFHTIEEISRKGNKKTVYVRLLEEGVDVFRPVTARVISQEIVELEGFDIYDPEDEIWKFAPGTRVLVEEQQRNGKSVLVAIHKL